MVWGESQGGHAALWTGQLASVEGDRLQLLGVAAGAPPTDLAANLRQASNPNARTLLTALAVQSWSQTLWRTAKDRLAANARHYTATVPQLRFS